MMGRRGGIAKASPVAKRDKPELPFEPETVRRWERGGHHAPDPRPQPTLPRALRSRHGVALPRLGAGRPRLSRLRREPIRWDLSLLSLAGRDHGARFPLRLRDLPWRERGRRLRARRGDGPPRHRRFPQQRRRRSRRDGRRVGRRRQLERRQRLRREPDGQRARRVRAQSADGRAHLSDVLPGWGRRRRRAAEREHRVREPGRNAGVRHGLRGERSRGLRARPGERPAERDSGAPQRRERDGIPPAHLRHDDAEWLRGLRGGSRSRRPPARLLDGHPDEDRRREGRRGKEHRL